MKNFRTFTLAVDFSKRAKAIPLPYSVKDQLTRASMSIALNLAEGRGRATIKEQKRFFNIAFGSAKECKAILMIEELEDTEEYQLLDRLTASLYFLIKNAS